jgi:flagellar biosynthetic protein FliR
MFELIDFLTKEQTIINFFLLFARFGGLFMFIPFFSYTTISVNIKTAIIFLFTIVLFPIIQPHSNIDWTASKLILGVIGEVTLGLVASLILNIVFYTMSYASQTISFVMGFSMANVMDPSSGQQTPVMGQLLNLTALLFLLSFDGHHLILLFIVESLKNINLGGFLLSPDIVEYTVSAITKLFIVGFTMAFPILALSLLADIIFGMIMKTNPQFNLLVIGFPVKIALAFMVLIAILGSLMLIFKREFIEAFNSLRILF